MTTVKWADAVTSTPAGAMPTEVRLGRGMSDVQIKEAVVSAGAYGARAIWRARRASSAGSSRRRRTSSSVTRSITRSSAAGAPRGAAPPGTSRAAPSAQAAVAAASGAAARGPRKVVDLPEKRECYWMSAGCNDA